MAQIITLPTPDKDELDAVLKEEKNPTKSRARREFLEKRNNILQRIQKRDGGIMSGKKTLFDFASGSASVGIQPIEVLYFPAGLTNQPWRILAHTRISHTRYNSSPITEQILNTIVDSTTI